MPSRARLADIFDLLRLAAPAVVARAGIMVMALVDTIVVGRFGTEELAFQSIGLAPTGTLIVATLGLLMGTMVASASAFGRDRPAEAGAAWRRSLTYALVLGGAAGLACLAGESFLLLSGQSAELAAGGGAVMRVIGLGLPAHLLFATTTFFLEGIRRPLPGMVMMIVANLVNFGLNWVLVWGHLGFEPMGAVGSAWATTGVRWLLAAAALAYVWHMPGQDRFAVREPAAGGWRAGAEQRRVGYATGASIGVEAAAFSGMSLFVGHLGALPLAGFSIAFNLIALVFMVALGLASATAVRVGIARGQGDVAAIARAGWTGLAVTAAAMAASAAVLIGLPEMLADLYTRDQVLVRIAAPLVALAGLVLLADGGQVVMAHALRGAGDSWVPTASHLFSYLVIMLPLGWALTGPLGHGAAGAMYAILGASLLSVGLLALRFAWLTGDGGRRILAR